MSVSTEHPQAPQPEGVAPRLRSRFSMLGSDGQRIAQALLLNAQQLLRAMIGSSKQARRPKQSAAPRLGHEPAASASARRAAAGAAWRDEPERAEDLQAATDTDAMLTGRADPVHQDGVADPLTVVDPAISFEDQGTYTSGLSLYRSRLRKLPALTLGEEIVLARAAQAGDLDAQNRLVAHSLHIVPGVAREFVGRGLALEDLIEEGNLGLYRAVMKFDGDLGFRFGTYARWWVRHEIRTAILNTGRLVRLPVHVYKALSRLRRNVQASGGSMENGLPQWDGEPAPGELERPGLGDAHALLQLAELPLSLDRVDDAEEGASLLDQLPATASSDPAVHIELEQNAQVLMRALATLSPVERTVVERRFGLQHDVAETLESVGSALQLSAERVRQIQKQALTRLREALVAQGVASTLDI